MYKCLLFTVTLQLEFQFLIDSNSEDERVFTNDYLLSQEQDGP